jgi:predicted MFS family arabinose efflux permease
VSWPATQFLLDAIGWRGAYLVYAGLLAFIAAPLHALALPRQRVVQDAVETEADKSAAPHLQPASVLPPHGLAFLLVATAFSSYAFIPSALSAQLLAMFGRFGLPPATVVAIGMLFGPAQVVARIGELAFAPHAHPLWIARLAVGLLVTALVLLMLLHFSATLAACFAVMYGMANGLMTIARGTVPLSLFGASGYGRLVGRIGGPFLVMQAAAPVCLSFVIEALSDSAGLALIAAFAVAALLCFALIRRPSQ